MRLARLTLRLPIAAEPGSDPVSLIETARRAETAGFSAVSISDHVVMGAHADRYPWGDFAFPPEAPWFEPLSVLTAIAAATTRLGLTTGILIVPLRPAVLLAKWAATVDVICGGRLELGVGTGWQKEEFDALGVDHERRGQMLTDSIGACRTLWRDDPASWESSTVSFTDIWCDPKPVQAGGIPILFSGTLTPRNVRRIVELGDGWIPIMGERRDGIAAGIDLLRRRFAEAGRDPDTLRVRSAARIGKGQEGAPELGATIERSADLIESGVTDLDVPLTAFGDPDRFFEQAASAISATDWIPGRGPRTRSPCASWWINTPTRSTAARRGRAGGLVLARRRAQGPGRWRPDRERMDGPRRGPLAGGGGRIPEHFPPCGRLRVRAGGRRRGGAGALSGPPLRTHRQRWPGRPW